MRVSLGMTRGFEVTHESEGVEAKRTNRPQSPADASQSVGAASQCHPNADGGLRRLEAELHVLHNNLSRMEQFMRQHPAQAASVRPLYDSQRALYNQFHAAYRQRTGHDFDPHCAGAPVDTRVQPWNPPGVNRSGRDYVV
jgi:hypothetical protein